MYKTLISIALVFTGIIGSTAQINKQLSAALQANPKKSQPVYIEFYSHLNLDSLGKAFNQQSLSSPQRTKILNRLLLRQSAKSQKKALSLLTKAQIPQEQYRSFYILNGIVGHLPAPVILQLAHLPQVSAISWAKGHLALDAPLEGSSLKSKKSVAVGGIEPGLAAINVPAMWARGYTGRGRKVYIFDSGVWAEHPSFANRYLGHRTAESAAWFGLFSPLPSGALSSHGTHVLGTTAGLDTATADTIGVAFGSYWLANDLINATTAAALPPQAFLIAGFEWALNPDGDTSTTYDIPDVINNSWRWRDVIDTAQCGGFVPRLMNTIEAAGIANVFSGGNTGPNNNGLNAPQRINTNLVNTFCVGSIDANQSFPYPISNFSTRGPTQCPGSGALSIHPEVVAPGQNVRSAWGADGYNTISGTSMASPHVSGAVLLLKEAFPQLTGKELMEALYFSALDMGPAGEDNTFGRGLINVEAAFTLLNQTHTPVNPNQIDYDLELSAVSAPQGLPFLCDSSFSPQLSFTNRGNQAITSLTISVYRDGALVHSQLVNTPSLQSLGDTALINLATNLSIPQGFHVWRFHASTGFTEYDSINNNFYIRLERNQEAGLAFTEDFEDSLSLWGLNNPDRGPSWDTATVTGWPGNTQARAMYFSDYLPRESQYDDLYSAQLNLNGNATTTLAFDRAYQARGPISALQDSLHVMVSTNCGESYNQVYQKAGVGLATVSSTGRNFSPASRSQWQRDTVDLSAFAGQEVIVVFRAVNRNGNNLYLDNISVYEGAWDPLATPENILENTLKVYPNPAHNYLMVESTQTLKEPLALRIFNSKGQKVWQGKLNNSSLKITLNDWPAGVYSLQAFSPAVISRVTFVVKQ
jgi:bacillopeptidase F